MNQIKQIYQSAIEYAKRLAAYASIAAAVAVGPKVATADFDEATQTSPPGQLEIVAGQFDADSKVDGKGNRSDLELKTTVIKPTLKYKTDDGKTLITAGLPYLEKENDSVGQSESGIGDIELMLGRQGKTKFWKYMGSFEGVFPTGDYNATSKVNTGDGDTKAGIFGRASGIYSISPAIKGTLDAGVGVAHTFEGDSGKDDINTATVRLTPGVRVGRWQVGYESIAEMSDDGAERIRSGPIVRGYFAITDLVKGHITIGYQLDNHVIGPEDGFSPSGEMATVRLRLMLPDKK